MRKKFTSLILILILALSTTHTAYATSVSDLQKQRQEKENEKKGTQGQLDSLNDQINDLSGEKEDVEAQISGLTSQIAEIMASVSLLEDEIADTEEQIKQAQKDYDAAKEKEDAQYRAMKKRIQYLYEKGETSYIELLMAAKSWSDMLNKAEYVQEIYTYDRNMLDDYAATVKQVAALKESLEEQKSELQAAEYELEQEKASLQESLDEQKAIAADYDVQLAKAKQEAAAYKAKIKQQNAEIQKLASAEQAKKAEEEAKRKAAEQKNNSSSQNSSGTAPPSAGGSKTVPPKMGSGTGSDIAQYACQFVGNPYVPGGTSLTNGTDCSGFTMSVFRKFGISLPRTSGSQSGVGRKISVSEARAGDLIFYARNGHVNHVALCIGGGRVVHASNPSVGITTSNIGYRTPYCARRVIG